MDPILRRSSFYYVTSAVTYLGIMGRYLVTRDWTVFEIIPLFMPVWLISALLASEYDERYAFLRTLPVPDRTVVRTKFVLILSSAAFQWTADDLGGARPDGRRRRRAVRRSSTSRSCACSASSSVAGFQIGIWRFGLSAMKPAIVTSSPASWSTILHLASLKNVSDWPVFSQLGLVEWLGGAPWISSAALIAIALLAFRALMRVGIRVKAASEAHL